MVVEYIDLYDLPHDTWYKAESPATVIRDNDILYRHYSNVELFSAIDQWDACQAFEHPRFDWVLWDSIIGQFEWRAW